MYRVATMLSITNRQTSLQSAKNAVPTTIHAS